MEIPSLLATPQTVDNSEGSSMHTSSWQFVQNGYPEGSARISLQQVMVAMLIYSLYKIFVHFFLLLFIT